MAYEPDTKLRDLRKNGQVVQPDVEFQPDNNGWPEPLVDPSTPYKIGITNGKNGEQNTMDENSTSQKSTGGWSLGEGRTSDGAQTQPSDLEGQRGNEDNVSQKIWSDPAGSGAKAPEKQWLDEDEYNETRKDPFKTIQQIRGEHATPESD